MTTMLPKIAALRRLRCASSPSAAWAALAHPRLHRRKCRRRPCSGCSVRHLRPQRYHRRRSISSLEVRCSFPIRRSSNRNRDQNSRCQICRRFSTRRSALSRPRERAARPCRNKEGVRARAARPSPNGASLCSEPPTPGGGRGHSRRRRDVVTDVDYFVLDIVSVSDTWPHPARQGRIRRRS